jgi:uncharacterized protein YaaQ
MKKMIMAIVPRDRANNVLEALVDAGYSATFTESRGGMLRRTQQLLFIIIDDEQVDDVMAIFGGESEQSSTRRRFGDAVEEEQKQSLSNTVVFVWDINRMETF